MLVFYGVLVIRVIYKKKIYCIYLGVDVLVVNFMCLVMYGVYYYIINLIYLEGLVEVVDVVGLFCENNDKFVVNCELFYIEIGDLLIIYDIGVYGFLMGYQYNVKFCFVEIFYIEEGKVC